MWHRTASTPVGFIRCSRTVTFALSTATWTWPPGRPWAAAMAKKSSAISDPRRNYMLNLRRAAYCAAFTITLLAMGCQGEKPGPSFDDEATVDPQKAWSQGATLT